MKPNKLKFNGTTFASKAEMEFAKHLTEVGIDWEYEPVKVPYVLPPRTYKPDFRVNHNGSTRLTRDVLGTATAQSSPNVPGNF